MNSLYRISGLKCSYDNGKHVVLEINDLELPAGQTIFIVGVSGIGKSTILETLGMMTNTLHIPESTTLIFENPLTGKRFNLVELWKMNDRALSAFRNEHFSFIFQNTNLMNNLSAYENVQVTQLIQGKSFGESLKRTREMFGVIGLGSVREKQNVHSLSGGQRQRLAFCRAIAPDFSVLFGDEPTGNLDITNARNVMDVLKKIISEKQRSAIIVSHDIDLALTYGDMIVNIQKKYRACEDNIEKGEMEPYGFISRDSVMQRIDPKTWRYREASISSESLKNTLVEELLKSGNSETLKRNGN